MDEAISSSELRTAMRLVLRASSYNSDLVDAQEEGPPGGNSPQFRELVQAIIFSRRFILTYQVVLICLLAGFTTAHLVRNTSRCRRRRTIFERRLKVEGRGLGQAKLPQGAGFTVRDGMGSSSSSTLVGTPRSPSPKLSTLANERSHLLPSSRNPPPTGKSVRILGTLRGWLNYQPCPIPIVNKTLPSNAMSLTVLILIGINIFYTLYKVPFTIPMLFVFADRASLVFVANLPWLYLFAAKNQSIKLLTGYSYESLNILHRQLGELMCLAALLHSVGMIGVWYTLLRPIGFSLAKFLLSKIILLGIGAFVAYESLYITSLGSFRQRWYELFLGLHIILQIVALVLLFFHHHGSRIYVGIALAVFLIDRIMYRMTLKSSSHTAELSIYNDKKTVGVHLSIPLRKNRAPFKLLLGASIPAGWKPTDHIFLTVPAISRKHIIQSHPFTIASHAPTPLDEVAHLDLLIRARDGFSSDLLRYAENHAKATVRLDGPYGSQHAIAMLQDSDLCVLVAGGSGIAVTWPAVCAVTDPSRYAHNDLENDACAQVPKRVLFIWVVQKTVHLSWLGKEKVAELRSRGVVVVIPAPTEERGRPDIAAMIDEWVMDNDNKFYDGRGRVGVVCSGPDGMGRVVRNTCAALQGRGRDVSVCVEKFGW
ncbi:hypothetical protein MMC30_001929 [Trapelia coarctata]|nr:hypothetical protein [Trapelia coarctata]